MAATIEGLGMAKIAIVGATALMPAVNMGMQKREHGGPVQAGMPYIVGERRPELFVPSQSGYIYPSVPKAGQGNSVTINNTYHITGVGADIETNTRRIAKQAAEQAKAEMLVSMDRAGGAARASGRIR
jgi:phage-related minor tail protein